MMKKLIFTLLVAAVAFSCKPKSEVALSVSVKDTEYDVVEISCEDVDTLMTLDPTGNGVVNMQVKKAGYGMMRYKWRTIPIYVEPGKPFKTLWDMAPDGLMVTFEGEGADKNNYMNGTELKTPVMGDFGLAETEFLAKMDQIVADNYAVLESKKFDKKFVAKEKQRIDYMVYGILWQYTRRAECSDAIYTKMQTLLSDDDELMILGEYTNFLQGATSALANRGTSFRDLDFLTGTVNTMKYAAENLKSDKMREFVIGMEACGYVAKEGVSSADEIKAIFEQNVTDSTMKASFDQLYAQGTAITKGAIAPAFAYKDINGKEVTLESLKGKAVYIDIWATWCTPCRAELPALAKLEKLFNDKGITFVSISIDEDKAEWEKVVKGEKLGGIQLHFGGDNSFIDTFQVQGIPRFILIDAEGKIVEANMTRPSDERTIEHLSMYAM